MSFAVGRTEPDLRIIEMKRKAFIAGLLSLIVPGLGQIYCGNSTRGGMIIFAAIVIGNLNIIILPLISIANPIIPPTTSIDARTIWTYWIPKIGHDLLSFWSIVFWLWAIFDAIAIARRK